MHFADISPRIKLSLEGTSEQHDAIFGRGVAQLCRGVDRTGSLNKAAKEIGMAYSKAWRIIKHTEEAFSMQLLDLFLIFFELFPIRFPVTTQT